MDKICYETSKDYTHLKELLDNGIEVIGFTTYNFWRNTDSHKVMMVSDVCRAKLLYKGTPNESYTFGVRGNGYGDYCPNIMKCSFEKFCEALDFEYIEPNKIEK